LCDDNVPEEHKESYDEAKKVGKELKQKKDEL